MSKIEEAREILLSIGMPKQQQNDICCYSLLAMNSINENTDWNNATNEWIRIHGIIDFTNRFYNIKYAENSRETFRKQAIHPFRDTAIIEDNSSPTNSPNFRYRMTGEALNLFRKYGTASWSPALAYFLDNHQTLKELYASKKQMTKMPVTISKKIVMLTSGKHNVLQKLILEEFAPRFAPFSECIYLGDSAKRDLFKNDLTLERLGFSISVHDKMPDVILYRPDKDWIYFIEAVTSSGPVNPQRIIEIKKISSRVKSGKIYVPAFMDFRIFKSFCDSLAWETEAWIADHPEHIIHMNGNIFLSPRK
ncbi:MAG: restriction endonuclease [Deltaproteobacteria bacterium]|jgi:hypothetical protein|nr:restriction endonuclease [Deltaproteobacteria bacterium]